MVLRLFAVALLAVAAHAAPAAAQEPGSTTTTLSEVPIQHIIPEPNTGEEPHEAGDRGGALQLGLLALLVVTFGGAIAVVVRQSRRARAGST